MHAEVNYSDPKCGDLLDELEENFLVETVHNEDLEEPIVTHGETSYVGYEQVREIIQ